MIHSLEDLAERADDRGDGRFYILRHGGKETEKRWEANMRTSNNRRDSIAGRGDTPDEAVKDLLDKQEAGE